MLFFSRVIIRFFDNLRDEDTGGRLQNDNANMNEDFEYGETPYELLPKHEQRKYRNNKESELIKKNISENNYPQILENFQRKFDDFMKELLEHLT
jgi:hypothetical protein